MSVPDALSPNGKKRLARETREPTDHDLPNRSSSLAEFLETSILSIPLTLVWVSSQVQHRGIVNWGERERAPHRRVCCKFSMRFNVVKPS